VTQHNPELAEELHQNADSYTPPQVPLDQLPAGGRRQALAMITTVAGVGAVLALAVVVIPRAGSNPQPETASNVSTYHHIRVQRPPGWHAIPATAHSGLDSPAAYWTNQKAIPQCTHPQTGESDCGAPVKVVHRDGVLVMIGQSTSASKGAIVPNATGRPAGCDHGHRLPPIRNEPGFAALSSEGHTDLG